jgi:branched-chain amino acid transport system permease protein
MLIVTIVLTSTYGWAVERLAYRPLRGSTRLAPLISAIGVSILLQNFVLTFQGPRSKPLHSVITGDFVLMQGDQLAVRIGYTQIVIFVITIALMIIFTWIIMRTSFGRNQRACEQDKRMAALLGVDVDRVTSLTFVIGAALAAVGGLLVTLHYGIIDFYIGFITGLKAFTSAVLGGVGSLPGAMLGGILIGMIEALWSAYFPIEYKDLSAFAVLIMLLIFRPTGLLGKPEIEKL